MDRDTATATVKTYAGVIAALIALVVFSHTSFGQTEVNAYWIAMTTAGEDTWLAIATAAFMFVVIRCYGLAITGWPRGVKRVAREVREFARTLDAASRADLAIAGVLIAMAYVSYVIGN
jgi:hypothetical protein